MKADYQDISLLQQGQPPVGCGLIADMTIGREVWLEHFYGHYLETYIAGGGSKVKVLVGSEGTGKTHLLRCIECKAREMGYATVYFSARLIESKLNDIAGFYRLIAGSMDHNRIVKGLCLRVAEKMGYGPEQYNGEDRLIPLIIEDGFNRNDAEREIRNSVAKTFKNSDFSTSFSTFAYTVTRDRLINGRDDATRTALKWLKGDRLERYERQSTGLFEVLQKSNARYWLNSLIKLLKFAGLKGLAVLMDDVDVLTERSSDTGRFIYSQNAVKDVCELFRQLIDDVELLNGFLLVLAGRHSIIDDERRGFKSYEALWMRLQSGLVPSGKFNAFADIVDVDAHLSMLGEDFYHELSAHLNRVLQNWGFRRKYREQMPDLSHFSRLRAVVMENALMTERMEE